MAAKFQRGRFGRLRNPEERYLELVALCHLSLAATGRHLGVTAERARQLFEIYGVERDRDVSPSRCGIDPKSNPGSRTVSGQCIADRATVAVAVPSATSGKTGA
jgi:hypothetical protein